MRTVSLRHSELARPLLLRSLLWQRILPPDPRRAITVLDWALNLTRDDAPLPPLGLIADLGFLLLGEDHATDERPTPPRGTTIRLRNYEDHVLGRLYADASFERAATAICRYGNERDRAKGVAFFIRQYQRRADFGGFDVSPALVKTLSQEQPDRLLAEAEAADDPEILELLDETYADLMTQARSLGTVLGREDVFELEHGTALAEFGQRLALRQVVKGSESLEQAVPTQPTASLPRSQQVVTKILDEDTYPVGGFTSISNRGTIESLLHSQLAYMDRGDRPDLFDMKFLRDELLYYSRDENQFLRRRRTFFVVLDPELVRARIKDAGEPVQRIIRLLSILDVLTRTLIEWLALDALHFEFVFLTPPEFDDSESSHPLADERDLVEMLFREQIALEVVTTTVLSASELKDQLGDAARTSLCHALWLGWEDRLWEIDNLYQTRLIVDELPLKSGLDDEPLGRAEGFGSPDETSGNVIPINTRWSELLLWLLAAWIAGGDR